MTPDDNPTMLPAGYRLRPPTMDDIPACLTLIARCAEALGAPERYTPEELAAEWQSPGATLTHNFRVIENDKGDIVAYGEAWDTQTPPVAVWTWGRVDPAYEDKGLGAALMDWAEGLTTAAITRCPPEAKVIMQAAAVNDYTPARSLFLDRGMTPVRQFYQMKLRFDDQAPPAPVWPEGIVLQPYRHPEDLETVVATTRDAFRDHWGFVEHPFDEEVAQRRHQADSDPYFDSAYWLQAMDGEEAAGAVISFPVSIAGPEYAYIQAIAVRRPWRRQGLATALLYQIFDVAYRAGKEGVILGVDADNLSGATRLYTRAGMVPSKVTHVYEKIVRDGIGLRNEG